VKKTERATKAGGSSAKRLKRSAQLTEEEAAARRTGKPVVLLDEDAEQVAVGKNRMRLTRKKFQFGDGYILQVGEIDFGRSGTTMEALVIKRPASGTRKEFAFNVPSRHIFGLRDALDAIIQESEIAEADM
jgi:hypothetical protein